MKYGYFDEKNKEYVITRPDTPTPWINYLGLEEYCAIVSNTGGGYSFNKDPRDKRILRYRYNNIPVDRPGRYIYIRDEATGEFWSCSWQPVIKPLNRYKYECRHGLGYTRINAAYENIESEVTYFVPEKESLEIWTLGLKNLSKKPRNLTVFSYIEFCLWQAVADSNDFQYTLNIANCLNEDGIIYHLTKYYPKAGLSTLAYFGANHKTQGFDCDREKFIGPYRSESNPLTVEKGASFNSRALGGNPIGSHSFRIKLEPNACGPDIAFVLGAGQAKDEGKRNIAKFSNPETAKKELGKIKANWRAYLDSLCLMSPDKDLNALINTWNAYQCRITFNWSRSASYYESGIGRGMGFRDSNQDCLGVLHSISDKVRQRIIDLAGNQFKNGDAFHQYFPLTKKGDKSGYSDDHLWLILSTTSYIKETGDVDFLNEKAPFAEGGADTLYNHLSRAVDYSFKHTGRHNLPLMGYADWNDCLNNMGPGAESVWVGQFLCFVCKEMAKLAGFINKKDDVLKFENLASTMEDAINRSAWDGNWYIRAFDTKGRPIGSSKCREGKIHLNSQSWAVLAGIAPRERLVRCMDMVEKNLATKYGIMLVSPPYKTFDPNVGAVGTFAPGLKENGGIFCHANPWAVIAEVMLGRADKALDYYKRTAPAAHNEIAEIYGAEPYVYSQFIAGNDSPEFGRAKNSWLTGSATWNFIAATWYILGIRPDYQGLRISPCISKEWDSFKVKRLFRGAVYDIEVNNPKRVSSGVKSIAVDGKEIKGNILPVFNKKSSHKVKVVLG